MRYNISKPIAPKMQNWKRVKNASNYSSYRPCRSPKSRWDGPFGASFIAFDIRTHEFQVAEMSGKCGYSHRNERISISKVAQLSHLRGH